MHIGALVDRPIDEPLKPYAFLRVILPLPLVDPLHLILIRTPEQAIDQNALLTPYPPLNQRIICFLNSFPKIVTLPAFLYCCSLPELRPQLIDLYLTEVLCLILYEIFKYPLDLFPLCYLGSLHVCPRPVETLPQLLL